MHDPSVPRHGADRRVQDRAAGIVEIDVEAAGASLRKGSRQIDGLVIIGDVIAIVANAAFHLLIAASQADDERARALPDLAHDTAHCPRRR